MPEQVEGLPTRREVERALRGVGLSHRQARKMLAASWKLVVGEATAEADELRAQLDELKNRLNLGI